MKMKDCLICEKHALFRVVLHFTKKAINENQNQETCNKFRTKFRSQTNINSPHGHGTYTIIIDTEVPNMQKKTTDKIAKTIKELINPENLEEGFIEIHEVSNIIDLKPEKGVKVCKT